MKKIMMLLLVAAVLFTSCSGPKYGCNYSGKGRFTGMPRVK